MFKDVTFFVVDNKIREIKSENVPKQIQNSFNKITKILIYPRLKLEINMEILLLTTLRTI